MTLLAPKILWTLANFCGSSGGKYGAKMHPGMHFLLKNLQAAHGELYELEDDDDDAIFFLIFSVGDQREQETPLFFFSFLLYGNGNGKWGRKDFY